MYAEDLYNSKNYKYKFFNFIQNKFKNYKINNFIK